MAWRDRFRLWVTRHLLPRVGQGAAALAGLGGWILLTLAVGDFLGVRLWTLSAGLLLFSLFGWRFAYVIARDGLYTLSRKSPAKSA